MKTIKISVFLGTSGRSHTYARFFHGQLEKTRYLKNGRNQGWFSHLATRKLFAKLFENKETTFAKIFEKILAQFFAKINKC
jgi:hypothetical protein